MSSKNLAILRSALSDPGKNLENHISDPDLKAMFDSWSPTQREELRAHIKTNALPHAMNKVFLGPGFKPSDARSDAVLSKYVSELKDHQLLVLNDMMQKKGPCHVESPEDSGEFAASG